MYEKIHVIITLIAAFTVALFSFIFSDSLFRTAVSLIITIIVFFVLGLIFKSTLDKGFEKMKKDKEEAKKLAKENEKKNTETQIESKEEI